MALTGREEATEAGLGRAPRLGCWTAPSRRRRPVRVLWPWSLALEAGLAPRVQSAFTRLLASPRSWSLPGVRLCWAAQGREEWWKAAEIGATRGCLGNRRAGQSWWLRPVFRVTFPPLRPDTLVCHSPRIYVTSLCRARPVMGDVGPL